MPDTQTNTATPPRTFIVLVASMMSITALSIDAILPALGMIGPDLKISNPNEAQFIVSFIFAGLAIGQLFNGPLSDAFGRKKVLFSGLGFYMIGSVICLFSKSVEIMLLGRFIQGFGAAGSQICAISVVRDKFRGRTMARVMSLVMMIFIMVPTIAPSIGQGILYLGTWHSIFIFYLLYAGGVMLWAFFQLEETLVPENTVPYSLKNIGHSIKIIFTTRATVFYTVAMGCIFSCMLSYISVCQQIYQVQFGIGDMFVVFFGIQAAAIGVASFLNSRMVERLGMRLISSRAAGAIVLASFIFLGLHAVVEIKFWMFFLYAVMVLFNFGLIYGNLNALAMDPMGHLAGTASAIINASSMTIAIILGTIIGQLYDGTLVPIISGFSVLGLLALLFMRLAEDKNLKA
ncbi:MAG TPA: multidrug effflux MFS transporter [Alphaproteobacteria bacterium]|nr:multidrug effflux MFS transporter [Alphaproteobacteria bacterium]